MVASPRIAASTTGIEMTLRIFVALHLMVLVVGTIALVWLGNGPDDAVAEALVAGAFATVGEAVGMRLGL